MAKARDSFLPVLSAMTSQGTAQGRFTHATERRNLFEAEFAVREMRDPSLLVDYSSCSSTPGSMVVRRIG